MRDDIVPAHVIDETLAEFRDAVTEVVTDHLNGYVPEHLIDELISETCATACETLYLIAEDIENEVPPAPDCS